MLDSSGVMSGRACVILSSLSGLQLFVSLCVSERARIRKAIVVLSVEWFHHSGTKEDNENQVKLVVWWTVP